MTSASDPSSSVATAPRVADRAISPWARWRVWVVVGVWTLVVAGFVLAYQTFWMTVTLGLGDAWGSPTTPDDWVEVWGRWIGILIGVGVAAIGAMVTRRWVALALALLILLASGLIASGVSDNVRPVAPIEHVDPGPPPCACYSGSFCDCPGG